MRDVLDRVLEGRAQPLVPPVGPRPAMRRAPRVARPAPPRPDPMLALERRIDAESDPRVAFMDALLASPHGRLREFGAVHARVLGSDPEFYGHLAAWYHVKGVIEDQRQLFVAHLAASPEGEHREASFVMLQALRTYQVARVVRYMKEALGTMPRRAKSSVAWWLRRREADDRFFDEVALRDRRNLKYLYATLRLAPSTRAAKILFDDDPPDDSRVAAVKRLARERNPLAVALGIVENRIFASTAVGLLKHMDAAALAALIDVMSPQQVLNGLRALERRGALAHPDLRILVQAKLARAATESRVQSARTLTAAAAIRDEETKAVLSQVATDRLRARGRIARRTALFVDKSGSMQVALEVGTHLASLVSTIAVETPLVYAFDSISREVRAPEGSDLASWSEAFRRLRADGSTSIGAPFRSLQRAGERVEQVVVITDGEENAAPFFVDALADYEAGMATRVAVVVVLVRAARGSALEVNLNRAGIDASTWVFDGDLYSLPNLVPYLTSPRRSDLCAEILETVLPVRGDLERLPPAFDPLTCELL